MLTPEEIQKLNAEGLGETQTTKTKGSLLSKIGISYEEKKPGLFEEGETFEKFAGQEISTRRPEDITKPGQFADEQDVQKYRLDKLFKGEAKVEVDPITGKSKITSPDIELMEKAPKEARGAILEEEDKNKPVVKLLKSEPVARLTGAFRESTSDIPLKSIARIQSIGEPTYQEAYDKLLEAKNDPNNSGFKKFMYAAQDNIPQMIIGLGLNFVPMVGPAASTAYWAGLSLEGQRQESDNDFGSEVFGNVAIDTIGDRLLGEMIGGVLKTPTKLLKGKLMTVLKGAGIEGGTEVLQTFLRNANSYRLAETQERRDEILQQTKDYVTSGEMAMEFGVGALGGGIVGAGVETINAAPDIKEKITKLSQETKEKVANLLPNREKSINSLEEDYSKWTGETKQGKKILAKGERVTEAKNRAGTIGKTPQRTLAEYGIIPETSGTKFDTINQADKFRESSRPLIEAEEAAIEKIRWATPPIQLDVLESTTIQRIKQSNETAGTIEDNIKETKAEFDAMRRKFGDSLDIVEVQKEKRKYFKPVPFEQVSLKPLKKSTNYLMASTMQKAIERIAAENGYEEVAQLNREVGDIMEGARFLERLSGQSLKYGKIGKYLMMGVGASLGNGPVGKVFGAVGGNFIANMLMKADVAGPVKRMLLKNLETNYPEAYTQTLEWIKKQGLEESLRLALPEPSFMPMGPETKTDKSGVTAEKAKKTIVRDPKTGRFKVAYTQSIQPSDSQINQPITKQMNVSNIDSNNTTERLKMETRIQESTNPKLKDIFNSIKNTNLPKTEQDTIIKSLFIDEMTGLPGRNLYERIDLKNKPQISIDLRGLGEINFKKGTRAADSVLGKIGELINKHFPDRGFRTGGDEFVVDTQGLSYEELMTKGKQLMKEYSETEFQTYGDAPGVPAGQTFGNQEIVVGFGENKVQADLNATEAKLSALTRDLLGKMTTEETKQELIGLKKANISEEMADRLINSVQKNEAKYGFDNVPREEYNNVYERSINKIDKGTGEQGLNSEGGKGFTGQDRGNSQKGIPDREGGVSERGAKPVLEKINDYIKENGFGLSIKDVSQSGYKEIGPLSTKILSRLEGKTNVSKQFIQDLAKMADIKQVEKDLITRILETEGDKINTTEFASKVKTELLPLDIKTQDLELKSKNRPAQYESITLPNESRGSVANYTEHIYESPIKTSAGDIHFSGKTDKYFGHTRIEDMSSSDKVKMLSGGKDSIRRVIEVQSDLYQKGNLEREYVKAGIKGQDEITGKVTHIDDINQALKYNSPEVVSKMVGREGIDAIERALELNRKDPLSYGESTVRKWKELYDILKSRANPDVQKLGQYNDPTAHFRMVREEIKQAAQDGKTKLQFPTGETAMKIEGLGEENGRWFVDEGEDMLTIPDIKVGKEILQGPGDAWIITDVLGDGKFKAVPKKNYEYVNKEWEGKTEKIKEELGQVSETFDISGKVDQQNPIYKFYEKELGKYLTNNFQTKKVTDSQGVEWYELDIKPEMAEKPVMAFGKTTPAGIMTGMAISSGLLALLYAMDTPEDKGEENKGYEYSDNRTDEQKNKDKELVNQNNLPSNEEIKRQIAWRETRGESDPYQAINDNEDGTTDYGKYQINEETLATYSEKYLGKKYTPQEFLDDPEAQEEFMDKTIERLKELGAKKFDRILALHHKGYGDISSKNVDQKVKESQKYIDTKL